MLDEFFKSNPESKNCQSEIQIIQESSQKHDEEEDEAVINAATLPHDHTAAVLTRRQSTESADARRIKRTGDGRLPAMAPVGSPKKSIEKYRRYQYLVYIYNMYVYKLNII